MIKLTDIVYYGNGFVATFDDNSVANTQFKVVNGKLTVLGLNPEQGTAMDVFNTSIDTSDPRFQGSPAAMRSMIEEVTAEPEPAGALWTFANITTDLWWDFSDSSTVTHSGESLYDINAITDKSGNGNDGAQGTTSKQPSLAGASFNGLDSAQFGEPGSSLEHEMPFDAPFIGTLETLFIVIKHETGWGPSTYYPNVLLGAASSYHWHGANSSAGILRATHASTRIQSGTTKIDGSVEDFTSTWYPDALCVISVVTSNGGVDAGGLINDRTEIPFRGQQGYVGELCIVESALSSSDVEKGEGYLAHKWGLEGNLPAGHPYKNAAPTT